MKAAPPPPLQRLTGRWINVPTAAARLLFEGRNIREKELSAAAPRRGLSADCHCAARYRGVSLSFLFDTRNGAAQRRSARPGTRHALSELSVATYQADFAERPGTVTAIQGVVFQNDGR